jgi:hypothetical protein
LIARLSGWGFFRYWWVALKLAITLVMTIVLMTVLVPRLGTAAATVAAYGTVGAAERLSLAIAPGVAGLFLIVNVALAVYKPRWRLRQGARQLAATSLSEPAGAH